MSLRVGIDIGSTTVKVVVLDEQNKLLFRSYERHYSKTRERACQTLRSISEMLAGQQIRVTITGSAGLGVANAAGIDFVQEVYATAAAVNTYIPDTDAVIELGGEDAKIIFFGGALEERMNGSCAGGTGAFIDQMATLMNVSVQELDALSLKHEKIYPIASRCGVFAKSDIQPILNQGGRKEDVAASIFQAVVDQTVAGLTQGRELKGKIVFLGGPLHFLMGLRERFVDTLKLDADHAIFPKDGDCFAAMGAALCAADYATAPFEDVLKKLEESVETTTAVDTMPPLFNSQEEYDAFWQALTTAEEAPVHGFEDKMVFEGCMPVEALAARGEKTLAFGPLKPVGFTDPRTGRRPFALLQLRPENGNKTMFNLVGCQTKLTYPAQAVCFRKVPGLEHAEFVRFGSMHRNTYVNAPVSLNEELALKSRPNVHLAGQITGVEGYVESIACGLWVGQMLAAKLAGRSLPKPPATAALGALLNHLSTPAKHFQPSNVHFGLMPEPEVRVKKKERKQWYADRARAAFGEWLKGLEKEGD